MCKVQFPSSLQSYPPNTKVTENPIVSDVEYAKQINDPVVSYRLYRRRFAGLFGFILLNLVTSMPSAWFGPISNNTSEDFAISINQVNWLGNIACCVFVPISLLTAELSTRFGILRCVEAGVVTLVISGWVRYAGIIKSLSSDSAYALLILGQFFAAISQPTFLVLGPKYSEMWFDLKGRTTATMIIAIANPIGSAVGQLISPLVGSTRQSILVLAIISTAVTPAFFLIDNEPPSPPTYAGSMTPQPLGSLLRAMVGKISTAEPAYMTPRERLDFFILTLIFGVLVGAINALGVLSAQYFEPQGYSDSISGLFGAILLLSGILATVVTAPLLDRVLTHHMGLMLKIIVPIISGAWLSLIWVVKPNNTGVLFAIMVLIGVGSLILLPVGLELGVELTRNANGSSAILWCVGNAFSIMFIITEGALRASSTASPPYNMRAAFVLHGVFVIVLSSTVFLLRAKQARREMDECMVQHPHAIPSADAHAEALPMVNVGSGDSGQSIGLMERDTQEKSLLILGKKESPPLSEKSADIRVEDMTHPDL